MFSTRRFFILLSVAALAVGWSMATPANAMPNFARQYEVSCSMCHTTVPRLNRTGYEFRRSGFRNPDEIGIIRDWEKKRDTEAYLGGDYFSARLQMNASYLSRDHATEAGVYTVASHSFTNNNIEFKEFTLYPLTGGFLGHWAAMSEISGGTDKIEVENAYVRYATGGADGMWEARVGVFHPFEGYGASDRPLGLSRPLIQSQASVDGLGTRNGFHPWGFDQTGIEVGFMHGGTSLSAVVFNGLIENAADPAQGGGLKKAAGSPTENDKDFQLFFNQFLGNSDLALGAYYYRGHISLGAEDELYDDTFDRYAAYLTLPVSGGFNVLAGYGAGSDDVPGAPTANNDGWFLETDYTFSDTLAAGARFDQYDPSDLISNNEVQAVSAFLNMPLNNGLQVIAELRNTQTEKGIGLPDQSEDSVNLRFIYIW